MPNITPNSVIVMDNALYHSVQSEKKLHELAKRLDVGTKNMIDSIAEAAGHRIGRLPPYHYPVEHIWTEMKTYVAKANKYEMAELQILVKRALNHVTPENG